MNLTKAEVVSKGILKQLEPFCDITEVVGKVRRKKKDIDRIDLLISPKTPMLFMLMAKISELGCDSGMKLGSKKTILWEDDLEKINVNVWFTTPDRWPIMLLLKTGGNRTILRIGTLCAEKDWKLSPEEGAIYNEHGKKLPIKEEKDIFDLLKIPYIEPSWRE